MSKQIIVPIERALKIVTDSVLKLVSGTPADAVVRNAERELERSSFVVNEMAQSEKAFALIDEIIDELTETVAGSNNPNHWKRYFGGMEYLKEFRDRYRDMI